MSEAKTDKLYMQVLDTSGKVVGKEPLDDYLNEIKCDDHILFQFERMYQTNQRTGTASTKDRSDVRGGGKKPWRQKGTGRARVGSNRSPLWTKGGVTFGPKPRDMHYELPRQLRRKALAMGLKQKAKEEQLFIIDAFEIASGKTKDTAKLVKDFSLKKPLIIADKYDEATKRSVKNLKQIAIAQSNDVSCHDILASKECIITKSGYGSIVERLKSVKKDKKA